MRLGSDWMIDILDAHDFDLQNSYLVSISDIVPGDTIEVMDRPAVTVENISLIRVLVSSHKVRRYLIEPVDGEPFQLPAKRKVRRL